MQRLTLDSHTDCEAISDQLDGSLQPDTGLPESKDFEVVQKHSSQRNRDISFHKVLGDDIEACEAQVITDCSCTSNVHFVGCAVDNVVFNNCILVNVYFEKCSMLDVKWTNVYMKDVLVIKGLFVDHQWLNGKLSGVTIRRALKYGVTEEEPAMPIELASSGSTGSRKGVAVAHSQSQHVRADLNAVDDEKLRPTVPTYQRSMTAVANNLSGPTAAETSPSTSTTSSEAEIILDTPETRLDSTEQETAPLPHLVTEFNEHTVSLCLSRSTQPTSRTPAARYLVRPHYDRKIQIPKVSNQARLVCRKGAFPLQSLDKDVRAIVYRLLLCPYNLRISDIPVRKYTNHPQLQYNLNHQGQWTKFTHFAWSEHRQNASTGIETAILRTNKATHDEATVVLYGQKIFFEGSAEGALSWLHHVSTHLDKITMLHFNFRAVRGSANLGPGLGEILFPLTSSHHFGNLCNAVLHRCGGLRFFGLNLGREFWWFNRWQKGAEEVFAHSVYLKQAARLSHGVSVRLHIEGSHASEERKNFVWSMERVLAVRKGPKPKITTAPECNGCGAEEYEECCFLEPPRALFRRG